jgi:DNA ligase-1
MINKINFKPMLCPNDEVDLATIKYPMFASTKLDGIRCIFIEGKMLSRSLKEIPNKQLQEKYQHLKDFSKKNNVILDGELYGVNMTFQEITHAVMSDDLDDKGEVLPEKLKFFCFDAIIDTPNMPFEDRQKYVSKLKLADVVLVEQILIHKKEDVDDMFEKVLEKGFEGLILKSKTGIYKFGRVTAKSGDAYKCKPFMTFDSKIIRVEERFLNTSESYTNELGRSQKHSFKDNKVSTGIAGCFVVLFEGLEQKVVITGDESFRKEIWTNKNKYIGKMIEFKGMMVGSKEKVRHPVFIRFREDKEKVVIKK